VLDPERLRDGHLDVVDEVVVPDRLEDPVGEAERDDVLDALLAQVVVDAEHVALGEHGGDQLLELAGRVQVVAERLLDHHPREPPVPATATQAGLADAADGVGEQLGDERQVVQAVAVGAVLAVEAVQQVADAPVGVGVGRGAGDVVQPAGERLPDLLLDGLGAGELLDRLAHVGPVLLVGVLAAAGADEGEVLRQQPVQLQVVEGGDDLAVGQVAGAAEHHHGRRRRDRPDPLPGSEGVVHHQRASFLTLASMVSTAPL
jgi:hypothetical protein